MPESLLYGVSIMSRSAAEDWVFEGMMLMLMACVWGIGIVVAMRMGVVMGTDEDVASRRGFRRGRGECACLMCHALAGWKYVWIGQQHIHTSTPSHRIAYGCLQIFDFIIYHNTLFRRVSRHRHHPHTSVQRIVDKKDTTARYIAPPKESLPNAKTRCLSVLIMR